MAQLLEDRGFTVERRFALGATLICFEALRHKAIDVYPEYTGTLAQAILKLERNVALTELRALLAEQKNMELLEPFGFNNTYALALRSTDAARLGLRTISDLRHAPQLRLGFSHEFLQRPDGWPGLAARYNLPQQPHGIEHGLIYQALQEDALQVIEVYSTEANIARYELTLLQDDLKFFPTYLAAPLVRADFPLRAKEALKQLGGMVHEADMIAMNAEVVIAQKQIPEVAREFLLQKQLLAANTTQTRESRAQALGRRTLRHLVLTSAALLLASLIALPLGILLYRIPNVAAPLLYGIGLLQTIPAIALLAFMIPLFGVGVVPAIAALLLYALLPIVRNTTVGLFAVDPLLKKVARGMGLTAWQCLRRVELPLAAPTILAGIKTAAVINIGGATLAAFIGAGGLGEPIVTGLALNDPRIILEGAVPAAILALLTELGFSALEKVTIPKHLL